MSKVGIISSLILTTAVIGGGITTAVVVNNNNETSEEGIVMSEEAPIKDVLVVEEDPIKEEIISEAPTEEHIKEIVDNYVAPISEPESEPVKDDMSYFTNGDNICNQLYRFVNDKRSLGYTDQQIFENTNPFIQTLMIRNLQTGCRNVEFTYRLDNSMYPQI